MSKGLKKGNDKVIDGVCSGIAVYLDMEVIVIRLVFLMLLYTDFPIGIVYIVFMLSMPED